MKQLSVKQMERISGGEVSVACAVGAIGVWVLWFNPELIPVYGGYTASAINICVNDLING